MIWRRFISDVPAVCRVLACTLLLLALATAVRAQPELPEKPSLQALEYTLEDLGFSRNLEIRGVDATYSVPLHLPRYLTTESAALNLKYRHSAQLLEGLSHLNIKIDGKHVTTLPVVQEEGGESLEATIELPVQWLTLDSEINLQLIGHYTLTCENPRDPSLWVEISRQTSITLGVSPKRIDHSLDSLPEPFFDPRSHKILTLPFVLPSGTDATTLEAAGMVASWFGVLADYRGARFTVLDNQLPDAGHAVVLLDQNTRIPGLDLPETPSTQVSVVPHPKDPSARLLVMRGPTPEDIRRAALALVLGDKALTGHTANITAVSVPEPRQAYDAPRWVPDRGPVSFGQLPGVGPLQARGFAPDLVRLGLRFPPDLYDNEGKGIPVRLRYHYTPRAKSSEARLLTSINGMPLSTLVLEPASNPLAVAEKLRSIFPGTHQSGWLEATLSVPVNNLSAYSELEFYFHYDYLSRGECKDIPTDSVAGRIDAESTLDISHLPHFIAMPDMAAFANAGFPFSKWADLSRTTVLLKSEASLETRATFLTLMGRIGASTGYPATHVTVARPGQTEQLADKDVLVVTDRPVSETLGDWAGSMPSIDTAGNARENPESLWSLFKALFLSTPTSPETQAFVPGSTSTVLTGFESPISDGLTVIVLAANSSARLRAATEALLDPQRIPDIQGAGVTFTPGKVAPLNNTQNYHTGSLGPMRRTLLFFTHQPLLLALVGLLITVLLGVIMFVSLRARAARRLQQQDDAQG